MKIRGSLSQLCFHTLESRRRPQSRVISAEFQADSAAQFLINKELDGRMNVFILPGRQRTMETAQHSDRLDIKVFDSYLPFILYLYNILTSFRI